MPMIKVLRAFKFSPDGVSVVRYEPGEHEVSERCAEVAVKAGWAQKKQTRKGSK